MALKLAKIRAPNDQRPRSAGAGLYRGGYRSNLRMLSVEEETMWQFRDHATTQVLSLLIMA